MLFKYRDLDAFAYAISERTRLSQPQAELYIGAGLLTGYAKDHGQFIISDDKLAAINGDALLRYKPYTLEALAERLGYEEIDVRRVLSQGLLPSVHSSGRMYLCTDEEITALKQKFPELMERAYDLEQKAEQEEEGLLGSRQLGSEGCLNQENEGKEQEETSWHHESGQGGAEPDILQELQGEDAGDGPDGAGKRAKKAKRQMRRRINDGEPESHAVDNLHASDWEAKERLVENMDMESSNGLNDMSRHPGNPYKEYADDQNQSSFAMQSTGRIVEASPYLGKAGDAGRQPDSHAASFQPLDYSDIGRDYGNAVIDSMKPNDGEGGKYEGSCFHGASGEAAPGAYRQMQEGQGHACESPVPRASLQSDAYGKGTMPYDGYGHSHAWESTGRPSGGAMASGDLRVEQRTASEIGREDGLAGVRQDSDTIISHAERNATLFYGDEAVRYVSRECKNQDGSPISVETHHPIQFDNMYHQMMDCPEKLRSEKYALHLANGERIPITEDVVHEIKSKPIPMSDSQELAHYEQSAFVDAEGRKTRIFSVAGAEDFSVSSTANNEARKQTGHSPLPGNPQKRESDHEDAHPVRNGRILPAERKDGQDKREESERGNADVFRVSQKKRMDRDVFSTIGSMAFRQSFGGLGAYAGYRTVKRYVGWVDPVTMGVLKRGELKAYEKVFRANNQLGNMEHALRNAGVKGDVLKNGKGKYKKRLSNQEVGYLMNQLREKFKGANLGNADLGKMSDGELKKLLKKLSGKDRDIVKCYAELRNISKLRKGQIGLARKAGKLLDVFGNALHGADFYDGMMLASRYAGLTRRMVKYGVSAAQWAARKVVRPYGRMADRRAVRKRQTIQARQNRKVGKKIRRQARRRVARRHRLDRLSISLTGKDIGSLKVRLDATKVGRGIGAVRGKLKPVMKVRKQAFGAVAKVFGKAFNFIGKIFSAPRKIALWLLGALVPVFLIIVVITLLSAAILSALNVIPESDNIMDDGKTVAVASADSLLEKDHAWYRELMAVRNEETPEEANDGNKVYGGQDPFSGHRYEISSFSGDPVYKYYDGRGFAHIAEKGGKTFDKDALSLLPQINLYSNAKAIMSAAAAYRDEVDIEDQDYIDFCGQLWDHSHAYKSAIGNVYMCSGCKSRNIACFDKNEYNAHVNATGGHYNFLPSISNAAAAKGCLTYYCNDRESCQEAVHKKHDAGTTYDKADKGCQVKKYSRNFMAYCGFSGKTSENPKITDCPNVTNEIKEAYNANGSYRDIPLAEGDKAASDFDGCSHARDFHVGDGIGKPEVDAACARNEIVIVKKRGEKVERMYNGRKFWLGYCPDMGTLGAGKQCGGYFLIGRNAANLKGSETLAASAYAPGGNPIWFYECQGHEMKERRFSYCMGHAGCRGHDVTYCLGHCNLEVYASIAGLSDDEMEGETAEDNLFGADNYFFAEGDGAYSPDWKGFSDDHVGLAAMILDNDWEDLYGLPDSKFSIDTSAE